MWRIGDNEVGRNRTRSFAPPGGLCQIAIPPNYFTLPSLPSWHSCQLDSASKAGMPAWQRGILARCCHSPASNACGREVVSPVPVWGLEWQSGHLGLDFQWYSGLHLMQTTKESTMYSITIIDSETSEVLATSDQPVAVEHLDREAREVTDTAISLILARFRAILDNS